MMSLVLLTGGCGPEMDVNVKSGLRRDLQVAASKVLDRAHTPGY
jgi:hypothetical protein